MTGVPLIAGVDLSVARVDVALIPLDDDTPLADHSELRHRRRGDYPTWSARTWYRAALREMLGETAAGEVVAVAIEQPPTHLGVMSASTFAALHAAFGAVAASVPAHVVGKDTTLTPYDWRSTLAPKRKRAGIAREHLSKAGGHTLVRNELATGGILPAVVARLDEHELDALGVALAWRRLQWLHAQPHRHLGQFPPFATAHEQEA